VVVFVGLVDSGRGYFVAKQGFEWFGEFAVCWSVVADEDLGEDGLVEFSADVWSGYSVAQVPAFGLGDCSLQVGEHFLVSHAAGFDQFVGFLDLVSNALLFALE